MKQVEYWRWMKWNLQGTKMESTSYHMDEETALERHPEAVRVPGSMRMQNILETDEEVAANWTSISNLKQR